MDQKRSWRVIHTYTDLTPNVDKNDVRMQREAHETKKAFERIKRMKNLVYTKKPSEIKQEEDDLIHEIRNSDREDLSRVQVEPCIDQQDVYVKLIDQKEELKWLLRH